MTARMEPFERRDWSPEASAQVDREILALDELAEAPREESALTDLGNAARFVRLNADRLRYCAAWGEWLAFDGKRWTRDEGGARVHEAAKRVVTALYLLAARTPTDAERRKLADFAIRCESRKALDAMTALAAREAALQVAPADLDADPYSLNCENGTLDLRSGQLRPHRAADMMTKLAPVAFDALAVSDTWERFLDDATNGDEALRDFLQRAAGSALVGDNRDERLFLVTGPAATGKSTFAEALRATLGDYATAADFRSFTARRVDDHGPRQDLARLAGVRLVTSSEVKAGARLAEETIKVLTGRDEIVCRFLYGREFVYRPAFSLWLMCNEAPRVDAADDAIWRRIVRLDFAHVVPEDRRDPAVKAELTDPARSGAAVLAWLAAGCKDWQRDGLRVPESVRAATAEYRDDNDPLDGFWRECCAFEKHATATSDELWKAARAWAERNDSAPVKSKRQLALLVQAKGGTPRKTGGIRGWFGVRVLS